MGRRASQQSTFSKGVLDPDLSERADLEQYYDSLAEGENSVFHPQGGFSDRGGSMLCSDADVLAAGFSRRLRRRLVPRTLTSGMITAINGGVVSRLIDQDAATLFQTNAVTSGLFVCLEIDLGSSLKVDAVDLIAFKSELAGADEAIAVQYYDGSVWVDFGDALDVPAAKHIRTTARTRRFATNPGGGITARYWRVVALDAVGVGIVSISGLRVWREVAALTEVKVFDLARQDGVTYELVVTERNIDVFSGMRYVASIPLAVSSDQVPLLTRAGGFDTMFLFHEQLETPRIVRQGSAGEWNIEAAPFANVPNLVPAVLFAGDQDEIQDLSLPGIGSGDNIHVCVGDLIAAPITYSSSSAIANDIETAIGGLPGVTSGDMVCELVDASVPTVRIRFAGANGNRAWPAVSALTGQADVVPTTSVVQSGLKSSGKYFEAETGWPRCGTVTQQRLMLAGFRAAPTSYGFSRNPDLMDFTNTGSPLTADLGFFGALDVDQVEVIQDVYRGRHLQIFTDSSEWYTSATTLSATAPAAFEQTTSHGIERGVPPALIDDGTLFLQKDGLTLVDYRLTEAETSYTGDPLSLLCPHLLTGVVDVAPRKSRDVHEGNLILLINADGTAAALTTLRKQRVVAGAPWTTDGSYRRAIVSANHDVFLIVERGSDRWLEQWTPDMPLDWATRSIGASRTVVTGADYLDGRDDVWAIADGEVVGPLSVASGQFTLPAAAEDVTFGLLPEWRCRSQVLKEKIANAQPFRGPARIYEMDLALKSTGQIAIGTNGNAHAPVPLVRLGARNDYGGPLQTEDGGAPGLPMYDRLYTGNVLVTGLVGFDAHPYWELSRSVPAPVHVKSVRIEVVHKGDG